MTDTPAALLRASAVGAQVGERWLVRPATFTVRPGEIVALTGPNGSGKTTLLRLALGRLAPTTGTLDRRVDLGDGARGIAAMTGPPPFYARLTIAEHLDLVETSWAGTGGMALPLDEVLEALDLARLADQYPDELSSGERQGIGLVMAFARPAALLVLDEPEQRLDARRRRVIAELMLRRRDLGAGVLLATHDPRLVDLLGAREVVLAREQDGSAGADDESGGEPGDEPGVDSGDGAP